MGGHRMITAIIILVLVAVVAAIVVAGAAVRVLREYERAVVFRLGRITSQRGPGMIFLLPAIDRMVRVSLRTVTLKIPAQEIITRDNVPARVTAVAYYRIIDPTKSVLEIETVLAATSQIAQTTLRSVLGKAELDALLSERESLNEHLQQIIDDQTEPWGVKVTTVEIKDVEIPERMQHAMARQAEAERERRAGPRGSGSTKAPPPPAPHPKPREASRRRASTPAATRRASSPGGGSGRRSSPIRPLSERAPASRTARMPPPAR